MFKLLENRFYRKVLLYTLAILAVAILFAAIKAAWREFQSDVDRIFPGDQSNGVDELDELDWYEPAPTRDGLPSVDDFDW